MIDLILQAIPVFREIVRNAFHGVFPKSGDYAAATDGDNDDKAAILRKPFELGVLSTEPTPEGTDQIKGARHEHRAVKRLKAVPLRTIQEEELMLPIAKV